MGQKATISKTTDSKSNAAPAASSRGVAAPFLSPQDRLLQLHRQYGNAAVQRMYESGMLQAKLKIGRPGDKYEREADSVAERVMSMGDAAISCQQSVVSETNYSKPLVTKSIAETITPLVQGQEKPEEEVQEKEEEEEAQVKLLQREEEKEEVQGKLLQPEEEEEVQKQPEEEEEKAVQGKLLQREAEEDEEIQKQSEEEEEVQKQTEEEEAQPKLINREPEEEKEELQGKFLQREENKEEEALPKPLPQLKGNAAGAPAISPATESSINNLRGGGKPLSESSRAFFEPRFGADFSGVKIHTDSRAADTAKSINAKAYTLGSDIAFGAGQYSPHTSSGRQLVAHELTHTIQQGATPRRKPIQKQEISQKKEEEVQSQMVAEQTGGSQVQGGWFDDAVSWVGDKAKSAGKAIVKGAKAVGSAVTNFLGKAKEMAIGAVRKHPGYALVASISGKDPITGKAIPPRQGGILKFLCSMVGAEDIYDKIVKANIIGRVVGIVKSSLAKSKLTWSFVKNSLKAIWNTVSINPLTWGKAATMVKNLFVSIFKNAMIVGRSLIKQLPPVILEGFLLLVGAPVKTIMGVVRKGANTIMTIVKNPMKFVGNLVGALKKGFFQFKSNIWKHLKSGLMGWLMGAMEGAGIQLPEKWDLKGIIHLVLQVLGLTYERIKQKVIKKIGPKGEQVVSTMEKTVVFVKDLVTKGPIAMWERIKEKAADIKNAVIDGIKNWIITKIVTAAITKLVSMCNPAGAIIQAVLAIYNTIMFFIERAKQIGALVSAVINSVASIASGKIAAAANWIEQSMARTIPVIISFLARLIGLGGISAKIKAVIGKIRGPVDKVVDKVVGYIVDKGKALFGKGKAMVKEIGGKLLGWLGIRKKFKTADGHQHTLFFEGQGEQAKLIIASEKEDYVKFIKEIKTDGPEKKRALKIVQEIAAEQKKKPRNDPARKKKAETIRRKINELAKVTATIAAGTTAAPPSVVEFGSLTGDGGATKMDAKILSTKNVDGSDATDKPPVWQKANRRRPASSFVRGHLLSQKLGGPGRMYNLTPITGNQSLSHGGNYANEEHLSKVEKHVKNLVTKHNKVVRYKVNVSYGKHTKRDRDALTGNVDMKKKIMHYEETHLATHLKCQWKTLKHDGSKWVDDNAYKAPGGTSGSGSESIDNKLPKGDFEYK